MFHQHEKLCVIDQAIAFMGGLDLCFGRWDTAQHVIADEVDESGEQSQIWPGMICMSMRVGQPDLIPTAGKDYNNPRVEDFSNLSKPDEDLYDRSKVPRMPWYAYCFHHKPVHP